MLKDATTIKVALLGDVSLQHISAMLREAFARSGMQAQVYEGGYGAADMEARNPASGLYAFAPDMIVILNSTQGMRDRYYSSRDHASFADNAATSIESVWRALREHTNALIVQGNIPLPYERLFGQYDHHMPHALAPSMLALNRMISERARASENVRVLDIEYIAAHVGRRHWFDEKMWAVAKMLCALEYMPQVAQHIADIALSAQGRGIKCLVLDLDNTLWGGVVGDDGLEGIALGHGKPEGEAFHTFQRFLRALKDRGIVFAVCSKNNEETALQVFREHPDMILKEEDIAVFVANWENKADNIRHIRNVLNIGFDAIAFLDDNPFERNLVREHLPEVLVPELPEDPADYVKFLSELNLFETASYTEEDARRADMYREEAQRSTLQQEFSNIDDYLQSLEMKAHVARFDEFHIPRIAQLILRSNQFNLTTRRYSEAECTAFMKDEKGYYPFYVTLADKFGDYGLIGLAILKKDGARALVDQWLMSCRVLSRGVEELMMNHAVGQVKEWGCNELIGEYIPTAKNSMVKDFYPRFGFEFVSDKDGTTTWRLPVEKFEERKVFIKHVTV